MKSIQFWRSSVAVAVAIAAPSFLVAQDRPEGDWNVRLGGGVMYAPEYEGSDEYKAGVLPMISGTWRDTIYFENGEIGVNFFQTDNLTLSFGAGLDGGHDEADSVYLAGLGDIDSGAEFTFGLEYEFGVMQAFASVSQLTSGSEGMTAEFGIGTQIPAAVLFGNGGADHSENRRGPMLPAQFNCYTFL